MRRTRPFALLFILLGAVPVVVGGAGLASFLLLRAGYGLLVGGLLPLLVAILIAAGLGAILGRAAGGTSPEVERSNSSEKKPSGESPREEPSRGGSNRRDDV